jgi:hypothetical protein
MRKATKLPFGTLVIVPYHGEDRGGVVLHGPDSDSEYMVGFDDGDSSYYGHSKIKLAPTKTDAEPTTTFDVISLVGAEVEGLTFERKGDEVSVFYDGDTIASLTIEQFRQVAKILDGAK